MIRKDAWPFNRTISGVRLCWELEEPKGPEGFELKIESLGSRVRGSGCRVYNELEHFRGVGVPLPGVWLRVDGSGLDVDD